MFKKFSRIENPNERLEIFNLLKFNISLCLRLAEFVALAFLISGLGWFIATPLTGKLGFAAGTFISVALMLAFIWLLRLPALLMHTNLRAAYGLDQRSGKVRFLKLLRPGLRRGLAAWLASCLLVMGLEVDLWLWTIGAALLCLILTTIDAIFPRLLQPENWRPPKSGEIPPGLADRIKLWALKTSLQPEQIVISTDFISELEPPRLAGLGSRTRLVISEKALNSFSPRELTLMVSGTAMGAMIKAPVRFLLLRLCALAAALPLAAILISILGTRIWGYPLVINPALITLVWLALWLGSLLANLAINLTRRNLDTQLMAMAAIILKDDQAVETALAVLADKNLEEPAPSIWREFFLPRHTQKNFLKKIRYHQHLSKFNESGET